MLNGLARYWDVSTRDMYCLCTLTSHTLYPYHRYMSIDNPCTLSPLRAWTRPNSTHALSCPSLGGGRGLRMDRSRGQVESLRCHLDRYCPGSNFNNAKLMSNHGLIDHVVVIIGYHKDGLTK